MRDAMRRTAGLPIVLLMAGGCSTTGGPSEPAPPVLEVSVEADLTPAEAAATITADQMRARISTLASDAMRGRNTPSPELDSAAHYLAGEFESFGLLPAGDEGSFIQRYPYEQVRIDLATIELAWRQGSERNAWSFGTDYFVVPASGSTAAGEAVYVGSIERALKGLPAEVAGKIVLVTTPPQLGLDALQAIRAAEAAGALGIVLVLDAAVPAEAIGQVSRSLLGGGIPVQPLPAAGLRHDAARAAFAAAGLDLDTLLAAEESAASAVTSLPGITLLIQAVTNETLHHPPNVVALLPGSDPRLAAEYVVFSAHFDHIGVGEPNASGDSIYNGADDDASGTSAVVEVAQAFASLSEAPARSILFLAVSGEEKGLLGSLYFSDHAPVPIDSVVANINLDMVGRNSPDTVIAIGGEFSSLGPLLIEVVEQNPDLALVVAPDPDPSENAFFRSDHVAFVRHEIPSIFLTAWLHDDYHQPSDEVDKIDADKAARIARLAFYLGYAIAEAPEPPEWTDEGIVTVREMLKQLPF